MAGSSSARYALLGNDGYGSHGTRSGLGDMGSTSWGVDDSDEETEATRHMSVPQLKKQQYQVLEEQDKGLEALSEVITRQKHLAQTIGDEVDYQNELIDDITNHVDRTRDRIQGATQRVTTIDRRDSTCRYWTVIVILLIIIIIIVVV